MVYSYFIIPWDSACTIMLQHQHVAAHCYRCWRELASSGFFFPSGFHCPLLFATFGATPLIQILNPCDVHAAHITKSFDDKLFPSMHFFRHACKIYWAYIVGTASWWMNVYQHQWFYLSMCSTCSSQGEPYKKNQRQTNETTRAQARENHTRKT